MELSNHFVHNNFDFLSFLLALLDLSVYFSISISIPCHLHLASSELHHLLDLFCVQRIRRSFNRKLIELNYGKT